MNRFVPSLFALGLLVSIHFSTAAQDPSGTYRWYKTYPGLKELGRKPSPTINKAELARQYAAHKAWWDTAFAYLKRTNLKALTPGRYTVYGKDDVYVTVAETTTKSKDSVLFEVHRDYADIHCVVSGEEMMGIAPYSSTTVNKPYDAAKDIGFYTSPNGKYYRADASTLFIMFPDEDAHCGNIEVNRPGPLKKVVVKVRTAK